MICFFFWGGRGFFYQDFDFLGCRLSGRCAATFWPGMSIPRCPKTHQWPNTTDYIISSHSFLGRGNEKTLHFSDTPISFTLHCIQRDWFETPLVLLLVRLGGWLLLILLLQRLFFPETCHGEHVRIEPAQSLPKTSIMDDAQDKCHHITTNQKTPKPSNGKSSKIGIQSHPLIIISNVITPQKSERKQNESSQKIAWVI